MEGARCLGLPAQRVEQNDLEPDSPNDTSRPGPTRPVLLPRHCHFGHSPCCCCHPSPMLLLCRLAESGLCPFHTALRSCNVRGPPQQLLILRELCTPDRKSAERLAQNLVPGLSLRVKLSGAH